MKAELSKSSPSLFRISVSIFVVEVVGIVSSNSRRRDEQAENVLLTAMTQRRTDYEMN